MNGCPDSDGDGIKDEDDKCPNLSGSISMGGCPDSDGDGVSDLNDPCPNNFGLNGQPCPDSDGDGLTDDLDNCPNEFGPKSNGGCKLPDLDNDGVPNTLDRCPKEPGSEELNGCPALPDSLISYLNNYSEIFFDFDSFSLTSDQKINLLKLSELLKEYEHINLNIDGHTSYEGESVYNMLLSEKRSKSVTEILISDGIKDSRLNNRSFGEDKPNYANFPLSERKKNRRVKISVNKK